MSKLDQLRALRERQYQAAAKRLDEYVSPLTTMPPAEKEAVLSDDGPEISGEIKQKRAPRGTFDRVAYQREYMRKRRAKAKP